MNIFFKRVERYFDFTPGQWRGLFLLVFLLITVLAIRVFWFPYRSSILVKELEAQPEMRLVKPNQVSTVRVALNPFNPNKVEKLKLISFGLDQAVATHWVNFVQKGGKFNSSLDVLKVYGLTKKDFFRLEPYFVFEKEVKPESKIIPLIKEGMKVKKTVVKKQNVNLISLNELLALSILNKKTADRFIRFRDGLGGFYSLEQMKEVYGVYDTHFSKLSQSLYLGDEKVTVLNLEENSFKEVLRHPYLNYDQVKTIFNLRNKGKLQKDELKFALGDSVYLKLEPYVVLDK